MPLVVTRVDGTENSGLTERPKGNLAASCGFGWRTCQMWAYPTAEGRHVYTKRKEMCRSKTNTDFHPSQICKSFTGEMFVQYLFLTEGPKKASASPLSQM